ncbi:hypothetical protein [Streptomyces shenzhenensis]|uniref:hypothetical protein n=1 Tax=Streptomyces shenzhenensis TaxID=943815 RepID=UPI0015F0CF1E|nr:hypothetical protein [Streptomyces shenzhenensis]
MTGIYALVHPDGHSEFREDVPDHMFKDPGPEHGAPAAFTIQRASSGGNGLHGHVSDVSHLTCAYPHRPRHHLTLAASAATRRTPHA